MASCWCVASRRFPRWSAGRRPSRARRAVRRAHRHAHRHPAGPPPFSGHAAKWRAVARALGLHHATTRARVIDAFLALQVGDPCTEFRRAESERVLRAQPFLADARVRVVADSGGRPGGDRRDDGRDPGARGRALSRDRPDALSLGNGNIAGQGLRVEAAWEAGRAYQTGFGGRLIEYATFDRPYVLNVEAFKYPASGRRSRVELGHPFFTDLQRISWHAGVAGEHELSRLRAAGAGPARTGDPPAALGRERRAACVRNEDDRAARRSRHRAAASIRRPIGVIVSDSGFAADTGIALRGRYHSVRDDARRGRSSALRQCELRRGVGVRCPHRAPGRSLRRVRARCYLARGFASTGGQSDVFLSGATYAGYARRTFLVGEPGRGGGPARHADARLEQYRREHTHGDVPGAGPGNGADRVRRVFGGIKSVLPFQLTLSDPLGGVLGYHRTGLAGSRRNVVRSELRQSRANAIRGADLGVALFGQVGTLVVGRRSLRVDRFSR